MLSREEKELICFSLSMRAGYIETGEALLRAIDAEKQGKNVKALSTDQMKSIIMIEDLMSRVLNDKL